MRVFVAHFFSRILTALLVMSNRWVLVTGGTGFVGRQICGALISKGLCLRCVVRTGTKSEILDDPNVEVVSTDNLFNEGFDWWVDKLRGIDMVIHAAWFTEPGEYLESDLNIECLQGSLTLAKATISAGVRRFVALGTCFEYDVTYGRLPSNSPLKPLTVYAATKVALFTSLSHWLPRNSVEFLWCRLFYLYGIGEDARRFIPYLRSRLQNGEPAELGCKTRVRDYLDVVEAGEMIVDFALSLKLGPVNICSGIPVTIEELAERIAAEYGRPDLLKYGLKGDGPFDFECVVGVKS